MIPSHDASVRSGNGWTIIETDGIEQTPGAHDLSTPLGIADGTIVLVILRAAERWAPERDTITFNGSCDGEVISPGAETVTSRWSSNDGRRA